MMGMTLVLAPGARAAGATGGGGAVVSGVVRDAQGVAQMGALVQVLTADAATVGDGVHRSARTVCDCAI